MKGYIFWMQDTKDRSTKLMNLSLEEKVRIYEALGHPKAVQTLLPQRPAAYEPPPQDNNNGRRATVVQQPEQLEE